MIVVITVTVMDQNIAYETGIILLITHLLFVQLHSLLCYNYTVDWRRARPSIVTNNPAYDVVQVKIF